MTTSESDHHMVEVLEWGPVLNLSLADIVLPDQSQRTHSLTTLTGSRGLLLICLSELWQPVNVRRILWLQRHAANLALLGVPAAAVVQATPGVVQTFSHTTPFPLTFPLLADPLGSAAMQYNLANRGCILLIDPKHVLRSKWILPDTNVWPKMSDILHAVQTVQGCGGQV